MAPDHLLLLANLVLLAHWCIVLFVVGGLLLIWIGQPLKWRWVDTLYFRLIHLATIAVVVAESWLGIPCPLTVVEARLRAASGAATSEQGFLAYWLQRLLYIDAPPWAFTLAYTAFGILVALTWWRFPPQRQRQTPTH